MLLAVVLWVIDAGFLCAAVLQRAANSITDRAVKLAAVAEIIEKDLDVLGATAIEDKLQVACVTRAALISLVNQCCCRASLVAVGSCPVRSSV